MLTLGLVLSCLEAAKFEEKESEFQKNGSTDKKH